MTVLGHKKVLGRGVRGFLVFLSNVCGVASVGVNGLFLKGHFHCCCYFYYNFAIFCNFFITILQFSPLITVPVKTGHDFAHIHIRFLPPLEGFFFPLLSQLSSEKTDQSESTVCAYFRRSQGGLERKAFRVRATP